MFSMAALLASLTAYYVMCVFCNLKLTVCCQLQIVSSSSSSILQLRTSLNVAGYRVKTLGVQRLRSYFGRKFIKVQTLPG